MISKIFKKFSNSVSLQIASLAIITTSVFHVVFSMQFWEDDYSILYDVQQNNSFYFPYQGLVGFYSIFYPHFGTNPLPWFLLGLLLLFISAIVFYWFVYKLFSNKLLAFMACLIYITSPVGIDGVLMIVTFPMIYFILTLFLLIMISMMLFYEKKKIIYYLISLTILGFSVGYFPHRFFFFGGVIILFELINLKPSLSLVIKKLLYFFKKQTNSASAKITASFSNEEKTSVRNFILRQLSLIFVWFFALYILPVYFLPDALKLHPESTAGFYRNIINYHWILNPMLSIVNMLFAGAAYIFYGYFRILDFPVLIGLLVITLPFLAYIFMWFRKKNKKLLNIYLFGVGYLYLTVFAFYPYASREVQVAAHRYQADGLPAYSILIICIYVFLSGVFKNHKKLKLLPFLFFISLLIVNIYTTQLYLKDFNTRAYYSKQFSTQMKQFIPNLPKNSLIYIGISDDANVNYRLYDSYRVGHYDDRAYFAVLYNMNIKDVHQVINDYAALMAIYKKNPVGISKVFGFEYRENGLTNITQKIRESLQRDLNNSSSIIN